MKYTVSINSKVSHIVDAFDDLILKNECRFDWVPLSSVALKFTISGDGRKILRVCKNSLTDLVTQDLKRNICFNSGVKV